MLERPAEIKALFSHSLDPVRSPGSARQDTGGRVAGPQQIVVDLEVLSVEARITIQARHGKYNAKVVLSRWLMTPTLPRCDSMMDFTIARPRPVFFADPCLDALTR